MRHADARPRWVKYDEKIVDVSDFAHYTPATRPIVYCPACNQEVILKLGEKNVHHYAHKASLSNENDCVMTQPETALHWNMKYHIQNVLQFSSQIIIKNECETCDNYKIELFLHGWDSVEVEYTLGDYILDVALLKNGVCIGAIEVYVTHQVDRKKFEYLQKNQIPLLEIEGKDSFYSGESKWHFDKPMPYIQVIPRRKSWTCKACQPKVEAKILTEKQHIQAIETTSYSHSVPLSDTNTIPLQAFKIVDIFYPSGEMKREIYIRDNDELKLASGELISFGSEDFMRYMLKVRLADKRRYIQAIVNEVTEWKALELKNNDIESLEPNYSWDNMTDTWHKKQ